MKQSVTLVFDRNGKAVSRHRGSFYPLDELKKATHETLSSAYLPDHIKKDEEYKKSSIECFKLEKDGAFVFFVIGENKTVLFRLDIVNGSAV